MSAPQNEVSNTMEQKEEDVIKTEELEQEEDDEEEDEDENDLETNWNF